MNYSYLIQVYAWSALAAGRILSTRQFGAAAILAVTLALGTTLLAGSTGLHAQETAPAAMPAAVSVNINSADAETLAAGLNGVGHSRAEEIVRYREAYGPFASAEELTEVKGIGKSTLDKNRKVITLE